MMWRGLPWWFRKPADSDGESMTHGEPGEGKRLIVTRRDRMGDAVEWTWVDASAAAHYDEHFWQSDRGLS